MLGSITIDFQTFLLMAVGIFGLVGFLRGWWKEAITTGLLVLLVMMLQNPNIAQSLTDAINQVFRLIATLFTAGTLEPVQLAQTASTVQPAVVINPGSFEFYVGLLIILIILSYFVGNAGIGNNVMTPFARLFGGILGLLNGFIILSLAREYILGRYLPGTGISAAASVPDNVTVTIANVPETTLMEGFTPWLIIIGGLMVLSLALGTRVKYDKGKFVQQPPIGYRKGG